MQMSPEAEDMMRYLTTKYVENNYPGRKTWFFVRPREDKVFPELRALGLIEHRASGDQYGLTELGHQWVMDNRSP
jgi:hypothetical protein